MKVIRACWTDSNLIFHWDHVPNPPKQDEVVYVWGEENETRLQLRGYETRLMGPSKFGEGYEYGRKLEVLDAGLKEFGEVLLLDWDCVFVKPMDNRFKELLAEKEVQVPLYAHPTDNLWKSSFKLEEGIYLSANFGFCYSRDKHLGERLLKLALDKEVAGCIEEFVFNMESPTIEHYVKNHLPKIGYGVDKGVVPIDHENYPVQQKAWDYVDAQHEMEIYLKHL